MVIELILCLFFGTFYLEGMDRPYLQLDLTSSDISHRKPPRIMLLTGLDPQEDFDKLICNKALFLKTLVSRERLGEYCEMLEDAEKILHSAFIYEKNEITSQLRPEFKRESLIQDSKTLHFVTCIAKKAHETEKLLSTIDKANIETVQEIITSNSYIVNTYIPWGCRRTTPLNFLLNRIRVKFISYEIGYKLCCLLLEKEANPNAVDIDGEGYMSLHYASSPHLIELLLSYGAKTNIKNTAVDSPLMHHIKHGYTYDNTSVCALIKSILFVDQSSIHERGYANNTALHYAAQKNTCDILQLLLDNGANCTLTNAEEKTAWHIAKPINKECLENHLYVTICNALKENDTSIIKSIVKTHTPFASMQDTNFSFSMLTYVVRGISIIEWAKKYCRSAGDNKLFESVLVLNQELIKQWVNFSEHNADNLLDACCVNMINPYERQLFIPLMYAIESKNISKISLLLRKRAIIDDNALEKIKKLNDENLTIVAMHEFDNQSCFKCHAKKESSMVYNSDDFELFILCKSCKS